VKVYKSINNNIVSAFDHSGNEVILIGKGIGYKAKEGDIIEPGSVKKIFIMQNADEADRFAQLFATIPESHLEIADEIFTYAKEKLNKKVNERALVSLADHISFAILRLNMGMDFKNLLLPDVRKFYPLEFEIGLYGVELMHNKLDLCFPEDEAASIAMHIINAEYDIPVGEIFKSQGDSENG
jgi:beta-glucoside operon transcriptional antiterminator